MVISPHAQQRWLERFPDKDLDKIIATLGKVRVGKKTRKKIQANCPQHAKQMAGAFAGVYYQISKDQIVFVMMPPETVITIFPLEKK